LERASVDYIAITLTTLNCASAPSPQRRNTDSIQQLAKRHVLLRLRLPIRPNNSKERQQHPRARNNRLSKIFAKIVDQKVAGVVLVGRATQRVVAAGQYNAIEFYLLTVAFLK
jgi:hypothetical protein